MSKEVRLAIFAIVILAAAIWGYKFLVGENIFSKSYKFGIEVDNVNQLNVSSPVYINGLKVGSITDITLSGNASRKMLVNFRVENEYNIPKDAVTEIVNEGVMGGRALSIKYGALCSGANCAQNGHVFKSKDVGLIGSLLGSDVDKYVGNLSSELNQVIENLGTEDSKGAVNETLREMKTAMVNIAKLTANTNAMIARSQKDIAASMKNISSITSNLADNNAQITTMINNLSKITTDLDKANIGGQMTTTINKLNESLAGLKTTLETSDTAINSLNSVMHKADKGDGTLAMLLNNKELYTNLERTSKNLSLLLQDLRLNPKRYVNVSLIGRKNKAYTPPEEDPAFKKQ